MKKILIFIFFIILSFGVYGCSNGKNEDTEKHEHSFASSYSFDASNHWFDCSCSEKKDVNSHVWDEGAITVEATEKKSGEVKYSCIDCGKSKYETIAMLEHEHDFNGWVHEVKPTCYGDGTKGYRYCNTCQKYFDENFNEISSTKIFIPSLSHDLKYVEGTSLPCNLGGTIGHKKCSHCGETFAFEKDKITLGAIGQWTMYPYGNWSNQEIEIVVDNGNTCMKIAPCDWYPSIIGFKKDVTNNVTKAGTYRLLVDVKAGPSSYVQNGKLDFIGIYTGGKVNISVNQNNLKNIKSNEWTTLEFEYTLPSGISSNYFNIDGYYWPETSLSENYVLIDNIRIVAADDESNTNLDGMGFGDFEGLINIKKIDSVVSHKYDEGVVTKEATELEQGEKKYTCLQCGDTYTKKYNFGTGGSISILNMSNSFGDDSMWLLYDILESLGYEDIYLGNLYIGGSYASQHASNIANDAPAYEYRVNSNGSWITTPNSKISTAVESRQWDFIISNQQSEALTKDNITGIQEILDYYSEKQPNAQIYWNVTWGHSSTSTFGTDYHKMYEVLMEKGQQYILPMEKIDYIVVTGTAIENARILLGKDLMRDKLHLDLYCGRYTAALALAKAFTGKDISNASHPTSISNEEFNLIVMAVNAAYENKWEVTDFN